MEYKEANVASEPLSSQKESPDWKAIFADWERSGLNQRNYCQKKKLVYSQFMYWRGRLKKKKPQLIPLRTQSKAPPSCEWIITVNSQLSLHINSQFTEEKLLCLLTSLGVLPC